MNTFMNERYLTKKAWAAIFASVALMAFMYFATLQNSKGSPGDRSHGQKQLIDLIGFNYTDQYISEYDVDGQSVGNIRLSTSTSGGSGVTCCFTFDDRSIEPIVVRVRWQVDGCTYVVKSDYRGNARTDTLHLQRSLCNRAATDG